MKTIIGRLLIALKLASVISILLITTPCMAFQLKPILESNNETVLKEKAQAHTDDVAKMVKLKNYSPEGTWWFHLFYLSRELRRYLSDVALIAILADTSEKNYSKDSYDRVGRYVNSYNQYFNEQIDLLNNLAVDNSFSSSFQVNANELKTLFREVINYNNKIIEAIEK
jgi:uncharacterized protein YxeA